MSAFGFSSVEPSGSTLIHVVGWDQRFSQQRHEDDRLLGGCTLPTFQSRFLRPPSRRWVIRRDVSQQSRRQPSAVGRLLGHFALVASDSSCNCSGICLGDGTRFHGVTSAITEPSVRWCGVPSGSCVCLQYKYRLLFTVSTEIPLSNTSWVVSSKVNPEPCMHKLNYGS